MAKWVALGEFQQSVCDALNEQDYEPPGPLHPNSFQHQINTRKLQNSIYGLMYYNLRNEMRSVLFKIDVYDTYITTDKDMVRLFSDVVADVGPDVGPDNSTEPELTC